MQFKTPDCLYELWQASSAPMFHTGSLWPAYNEVTIANFLTGTTAAPEPTRPLDATAIAGHQQAIQSFVQQVQAQPEGAFACRAAYLEFEQERLNNLELILSEDPARIATLNDLLYGPLDRLHQSQVMSYLKWYIEELKCASPLLEPLRRQLLDFWADIPADPVPIQALCAQFDQYRLHLRPLVDRRFAFVSELMRPYKDRQKLDSQTVRGLLDESLGHILGDRRGSWTAVTKEGAPNVFIDNDQSAIVVPSGREYEPAKISSLIIHEIGAHVTRAVNGRYSREPLAARGLAGYGFAEESFGVLLGATHDRVYDPTGSFISFAVIDFATRDGAKTFRELHQLTQAFMTCRLNPTTADFESKHTAQARQAFSRVIRASRKGTGAIVDRSTTKYWRGLLMLKDYFGQSGLTDAAVDQFLLGKYDCLSAPQLRLLTEHRA